ncbi:hypothetical protein QC764_0080860 [Podospora pseudoanserina]|uniref:Uncharacterized protein n=1 Tax=Podospora pseudoanserina TaxID=2609844 RepID=A0ABR0I5T1_9PEZI|nr:hypothetical protein QC764_0080860 [Podospora pseudoanserina]
MDVGGMVPYQRSEQCSSLGRRWKTEYQVRIFTSVKLKRSFKPIIAIKNKWRAAEAKIIEIVRDIRGLADPALFIELYDDIVFPAQHQAVSSMWLNLLALFFSSSDRFALERLRNSGELNLRVRVLFDGNRGLGTVLLNAKPLDPTEGQSLKESVWSNWRSQLEDHVSRAWGWLHVVDEQLHDAANIARFGAVTIGRKVQFFECIPGGRPAIRAFGHGEDELLEFKADEAKIIEIC